MDSSLPFLTVKCPKEVSFFNYPPKGKYISILSFKIGFNRTLSNFRRAKPLYESSIGLTSANIFTPESYTER